MRSYPERAGHLPKLLHCAVYLTVVLAVIAGALLVLVGAAWGYERSRRETVAEGVASAASTSAAWSARPPSEARRLLLNPLQEPIVGGAGSAAGA